MHRLTMLLGFVLCAPAAGCKHKIGDECITGLDCDPEGTRTCDISQPGGYCTVDGCTATSCPEDSACIRFFPRQYLRYPPHAMSVPCDADHPCEASDLCLPEGLCAPLDAERRYCMRTCGDGDDCRSGYDCRTAGTAGSVALVNDPDKTVRFCAARDNRVIVDAAPPPDVVRWFDVAPDVFADRPVDAADDDDARAAARDADSADAPSAADANGAAGDDVGADGDATDL